MTIDEKQRAVDLMEAQRLAVAVTDVLRGSQCRVVGQALSLVLAEFARTGGPDPNDILTMVLNGAVYFYNQHITEEPPSMN